MIELLQLAAAIGGFIFLALNAIAFRRYAFARDQDVITYIGQGIFWVSTFAAFRLFWWDILRLFLITTAPGVWDVFNVTGVAINIAFNAGVMFGAYKKAVGHWMLIPDDKKPDYPTILHSAFYPAKLIWRRK